MISNRHTIDTNARKKPLSTRLHKNFTLLSYTFIHSDVKMKLT